MLKALAIVGVTALVALGGEHHTLGVANSATAVVEPRTVAPGGHVSVFDDNGCTGKKGYATSVAFAGRIPLASLDGMVGGIGKVRRGIKPGTYDVTLDCGAKMSTSVTVDEDAAAINLANGEADGTGVAAAVGDVAQAPAKGDVSNGFVMVAGAIALGGYALRHRRFLVRRGSGE
jgi:hypothetical protein